MPMLCIFCVSSGTKIVVYHVTSKLQSKIRSIKPLLIMKQIYFTDKINPLIDFFLYSNY